MLVLVSVLGIDRHTLSGSLSLLLILVLCSRFSGGPFVCFGSGLQAKLDLASAVEEADAAAKMAAEARSKLEKVEAEHGETKMRLQSECAANEGLKAAVMEANEVWRERGGGGRGVVTVFVVHRERWLVCADVPTRCTGVFVCFALPCLHSFFVVVLFQYSYGS